MVKFNTPEDDEKEHFERLGNFLGVLFCGILTGTILGLLGLGIGLMFLSTVMVAIGCGLSFAVIGFLWGLHGGIQTVEMNRRIQEGHYRSKDSE
jgi:small-conductance mechanosensitive channel